MINGEEAPSIRREAHTRCELERLRVLSLWRWRWYVPPKHWFLLEQHGVISQETSTFLLPQWKYPRRRWSSILQSKSVVSHLCSEAKKEK
jgi:hypothetical protein